MITSKNKTNMSIMLEHIAMFNSKIDKLKQSVKIRKEIKDISEKFFKDKEVYYQSVLDNPTIDTASTVLKEVGEAKLLFDADYNWYISSQKELDAVVVTRDSLQKNVDAFKAANPIVTEDKKENN